MSPKVKKKTKKNLKSSKVFHLIWVFNPILDLPSFYTKRMFGGLAAYVHDKLVFVLTEKPGDRQFKNKTFDYDIWDGVMLPTDKEHHSSIIKSYPELIPHPALGKWLYLQANLPNFEEIATEIGEQIAKNHPHFGVYPKIK